MIIYMKKKSLCSRLRHMLCGVQQSEIITVAKEISTQNNQSVRIFCSRAGAKHKRILVDWEEKRKKEGRDGHNDEGRRCSGVCA